VEWKGEVKVERGSRARAGTAMAFSLLSIFTFIRLDLAPADEDGRDQEVGDLRGGKGEAVWCVRRREERG